MKRGTIRLAGRFCEIRSSAWIFGDWAVHRGGLVDWRVSHVPSGLHATDCMDFALACEVAKMLDERRTGESLPRRTVTMRDDADWMGGALYSESDLEALDAARDLAWGYKVTP